MNLVLVVNNIVDFNKIESGDTPAVRSTFVLQDIVEELRTLFSGSMGTKDVAFEVDTSLIDKSAFGSGDRLLLLGDDAKIRKIAINLLSNVSFGSAEGLTFSHVTGIQIYDRGKGDTGCPYRPGSAKFTRSSFRNQGTLCNTRIYLSSWITMKGHRLGPFGRGSEETVHAAGRDPN